MPLKSRHQKFTKNVCGQKNVQNTMKATITDILRPH